MRSGNRVRFRVSSPTHVSRCRLRLPNTQSPFSVCLLGDNTSFYGYSVPSCRPLICQADLLFANTFDACLIINNNNYLLNYLLLDEVKQYVASELKDPICHSDECQIGSFSSEATSRLLNKMSMNKQSSLVSSC